MSASVVVDQLVKRFGRTVAVDGASWSAEPGRITALLGPNGSGKTTTVECLEGLQAPTSGTVRVLGTDPNNAGPEHRALVGVMLQDGGLPNTAGAERLLRHLASLYENPLDVDALMQRLGIDAFRGTAVRRLSGGQRQRLALASAIVGRPRVVFLDEPSAGLDPHARQDVWRLVRELRADGVTVVITTHSFEEAERLADHVVVMRAGQVAASGTIAEIGGDRGLEAAYFALTDGDDSWRDQPTNCWPTPPPAAADDEPKGTQQ
ncbi:MAG: ABC transporter ATP-binding protein [Dermatophilus congolensis]|nr:ABC transporter ATP-binding protein [Dermatophilus congolensis]